VNILVTGGAGFIGQHLCRHLLQLGHSVTIIDNFSPQVHGDARGLPAELSAISVIHGDVTDRDAMKVALEGQQAVVHLAAETGTGQSMYDVVRYERTNIGGTAVLAEYLANTSGHQITKLVVASSRAVYGEGSYRCTVHGIQYPQGRLRQDMERRSYDPLCQECGAVLHAVPTAESAPFQPNSCYGLTKQVQEQMILLYGRVLGIPAFALRYQNVYGPGQSLSNPYTGILAIFCNLASHNSPIFIFEDGAETRDFVYIDDVVRATARCLEPEVSGNEVINVGSGTAVTVKEVAEMIVEQMKSQSPVKINHAFRLGDIRHNLADLSKARSLLGYEPRWQFDSGLSAFLAWAAPQTKEPSHYESSLSELRSRGLLIG
jgi:dTDP-L-rhamnose 4-epimerase